MTNLSSDELEQAQTAVFVLVGKCILNLQLYEQALKNLLPLFYVSSDGPTPEEQRKEFSKSTLGALVRRLLEKTSEFDDDEEELEIAAGQTFAFRSRLRIPVNAETAKQISKDLYALLKKRNFLVHHFQSKFRLTTVSGCLAAEAYLQALNVRAKTAVTQIDELGNQLNDSRALLASLMISPELTQLIDEMGADPEPLAAPD